MQELRITVQCLLIRSAIKYRWHDLISFYYMYHCQCLYHPPTFFYLSAEWLTFTSVCVPALERFVFGIHILLAPIRSP